MLIVNLFMIISIDLDLFYDKANIGCPYMYCQYIPALHAMHSFMGKTRFQHVAVKVFVNKIIRILITSILASYVLDSVSESLANVHNTLNSLQSFSLCRQILFL